MRKLLWCRAIFILIGVFFAGSSFAFDAATDCINPIKKKTYFSSLDLQDIFTNYTDNYSKKLDDGTHVLCFDMNNPIVYDKNRAIEISASINAPLLIYGLNIDASKLDALALFKVSGSNIIYRDSILKGPKKEYMLLDVTAIDVLPGSGNVTVGPNVNIDAFDIGVSIGAGTGALVTQTQTSGNVFYPIFHKPPAFFPSSIADGKLISEDWIGKNITESDGYKIDSIAGKVFIDESKGNKCSGEVELYTTPFSIGYQEAKKWFEKNKLISFVDRFFYTRCQVSKVEGKDVIIRGEKDCEDGQYDTKTIPVGTCYFDCKNLNTVSDAFSSRGFVFNGCLGNSSDGGTILANCEPVNWYIPQTLQFLPTYLSYGPCSYPSSTGLGGVSMQPVATEMDSGAEKSAVGEQVAVVQGDLPSTGAPPQTPTQAVDTPTECDSADKCPKTLTAEQAGTDNDDSQSSSSGSARAVTDNGSEAVGQGSGCSCALCVQNF